MNKIGEKMGYLAFKMDAFRVLTWSDQLGPQISFPSTETPWKWIGHPQIVLKLFEYIIWRIYIDLFVKNTDNRTDGRMQVYGVCKAKWQKGYRDDGSTIL